MMAQMHSLNIPSWELDPLPQALQDLQEWIQRRALAHQREMRCGDLAQEKLKPPRRARLPLMKLTSATAMPSAMLNSWGNSQPLAQEFHF